MPGMLIRDAEKALKKLGFRRLVLISDEYGGIAAEAISGPDFGDADQRIELKAWALQGDAEDDIARKRLAAGRLVEFVERLRRN